jgi:fatty acid desaturase
MVVALVLKLVLAVLLLYLLFWAVWLFIHKDALYYRRFSKDKKWKKTAENQTAFSTAQPGSEVACSLRCSFCPS